MKSRLPAASVACTVWRPLLAKVMTPSAALPSSSALTFSATDRRRHWRAFNAKRRTRRRRRCCPVQRSALRSERSTVTVPSSSGWCGWRPCRRRRQAAPGQKPRLRRSARRQQRHESLALTRPSTTLAAPSVCRSRQTSARSGAGQRIDIAEISGIAVRVLYFSTPSWMRISENDLVLRGLHGVAMVSTMASGCSRHCVAHHADGRTQHHPSNFEPLQQQRQRPSSRSARRHAARSVARPSGRRRERT